MILHNPVTSIRHSDFPIQSLWIGKLSLLERLSMASFIANGHRYHLYTYDDVGSVPPGVEVHDAAAVIPQQEVFQYRAGKEKGGYSGFADLFRYKLLLEKGGWWCDTDMVCLKPFRFEAPMIASERHWLWRRKLSVAVLLFPPGHPLMQAAYADASRCDKDRLRFAGNGEPLLRRHVRRLKLESCVAAPEVFNPIDWWRSGVIGEAGSAASIPEGSFGVHCFGESWRWRLKERHTEGFRECVFAPDTLLGALQRRYLPGEVA
jgi:hypothetical protein